MQVNNLNGIIDRVIDKAEYTYEPSEIINALFESNQPQPSAKRVRKVKRTGTFNLFQENSYYQRQTKQEG